jgi:hypothetical protein
MALTETKKVDQIEVVETNHIQIRTATIIERDGIEISRSNHRHVLAPTDDISGEDERVQAIANAIWTKDVIEEFKKAQDDKNIQSI